MGLDKPVPIQYLIWLGAWPNNDGQLSGLFQGDLGVSYINQLSVSKEIMSRLPNTLLLSVTSLAISLGLALPVGVWSAMKQYSWFDSVATVLSTAGVSIPAFWFGLIAILVFSVKLRWLPSGGMYTPQAVLMGQRTLPDLLKHLIMPAAILSVLRVAGWNRYVRASMLEVVGQDYVRTARAKGLREQIVVIRHVLRNALIPVATLIGLAVPGLVSGALITETIFSWPGMGRLTFHAATKRDYPIIMGALVMSAVLVIGGNLLADIAYTFLDPRITAE
jgi:peptide/nickel transport system permease protein